jgi:hypothetical protein
LGTGGSIIYFYFWFLGRKLKPSGGSLDWEIFKELELAVIFLKSNFNSRIGLCLRMKRNCITWAGLTLIKLFFKFVVKYLINK